MTEPEPLQQVDRTRVLHRHRKLTYFSGCDYFRLASHPAVLKAARDGTTKFGLNVAASRWTTGNHEIYRTLENALANFFTADAALLLPGGYLAPLVVAQSLAGQFSHALVDERAHAALLDAANSLDCPVLRFKHRDETIFAQAVARCGPGARLIVLTDGMFSHDGSVAPLRAYLKRLPPDGLILVDDAHGAGVLGKTGKGSLEHEDIPRRRIVQCVTLSKAIGVYGGAVLGSRELRRKILERSRMLVGSTPLPLPLACAALQALKILKTGKAMRTRLFRNADYVKGSLRKCGFEISDAPGPIISLHLNGASKVTALKRRLLAAHIFPPFIQYPGGPADGYFRFVISSEHSQRQLDDLISALKP